MELRETTVPAPEVTVVINSDITPRFCVALLVVRPAFLTPKFLLGRKGANPNRRIPDDMSTSSSSAMEVLTAATSATQVAVFVDSNVSIFAISPV